MRRRLFRNRKAASWFAIRRETRRLGVLPVGSRIGFGWGRGCTIRTRSSGGAYTSRTMSLASRRVLCARVCASEMLVIGECVARAGEKRAGIARFLRYSGCKFHMRIPPCTRRARAPLDCLHTHRYPVRSAPGVMRLYYVYSYGVRPRNSTCRWYTIA